jgi:hypothetical protein
MEKTTQAYRLTQTTFFSTLKLKRYRILLLYVDEENLKPSLVTIHLSVHIES